jgi:signal transduction histidine kinase
MRGRGTPDSPMTSDPSSGDPNEATLTGAGHRLESLWEHLPLGAVLQDAEGRLLHPNAAARRLLSGPDHLAGLRGILDSSASGEDGAEIRLPDGDRAVIVHRRDLGGGRRALFVEDTTRCVRERERRERAERLAAVGELAAGAAHEVNNPLASIKSFAQLLSNEVATQAHREALEIIIQESSRVARVVGELLSFARRQGAGNRVPLDLNEIVDRILALQRYALETAGVEVRRDLDASLPAVMGESGALQQVVLNLVVNAEQALSSRTGSRVLILRTRESSEGVVLSVVDNGPGIERNLLPHIFAHFHTTKAGGTGLGLGISAGIVRDHGGHIWAESEPSRGAAFFVRLPRAAGGATPPAVEHPPPPRQAGARRLRVLVADDEPSLRLAVSLFLARFGHQVVQAANAQDAYRLAESEAFDVAVVDARMPGDGLRLLEQLEGLPSLKGRTILMTGDIGRARTSQGITTGRPYLAKPFDMDELVRLVEKLGA